jgi:FtsZ-binding cell division protein ZapB
MSDQTSSRAYGIIVTLLLLLSASMGWFFWQKSKVVQSENLRIEAMRDSLEFVKAAVELELDTLAQAYSALRNENEGLRGRVSSTVKTVEEKEVIIRQIKSSSSKEISDLKNQIGQLSKLKTEYETIITVLRGENDQLKVENQRLTGENYQLRTAKDNLSRQLEDQLRKNQTVSFKATAFRVENQRKSDKLTTRAKKTREITISFDLNDVPSMYQGPVKLYMVITDETGKPIASNNPVRTTVYAPTGPTDISAQMVKEVILYESQRIELDYELEEKIKSGSYTVSIYTEKGLLGASIFRLS